MAQQHLEDAYRELGLQEPSAAGTHFATRPGPEPAWRPSDYLDAHGQILAARAGHQAQHLHPLAADALADGNSPSLVDLARAYAVGAFGPSARSWDVRQVLGASTDHLGNLLGDFAARVALSRQPALLDPLLKVARPVELSTYHDAHVGVVELEAGIDTASSSMRAWQNLLPSGTAEELALRSSPVRIRFPEWIVVNDDINAIDRTIEAASIAAAQNELTAAMSLLNTDFNLSDGSAAFNTDDGNAITGAAKSSGGLDSATAALRAQTINGKSADCAPRFLLVPGDDEFTARAAVRAAYGDNGPVEVIATAYLSTYWFLTASPDAWPWLVRATMRGSGGVSLRFSPDRPNEREGSRDLILSGMHTFDYAITSRVGAVRIAFA